MLSILILLAGCSDYDLKAHRNGVLGPDDENLDTDPDGDSTTPCTLEDWPAIEVGVDDTCPEPPDGGFTPVVEWDFGPGKGCLSLPVVADLTGDGMPEILANVTSGLLSQKGTLVVLSGDGSGLQWQFGNSLGYGSPPAVADLDGDGLAEIVVIREYKNSMLAKGDYTAVLLDSSGNELWESAHFEGLDFDYATAPVISDMDHDGSAEIVVGRVILNADGTTRGIGEHGRGSYGVVSFFGSTISEASVPAVTDLDLDGEEEVIVGNAAYDVDGNTLWFSPNVDDGMVSVANLDGDPEGEFVATSYDSVRAVDTYGEVLWGPLVIPSANILSVAGIADLDADGMPEIVVAGGDQLWCLNHDGTVLWTASVTDESGATGASIFDFEGDGIPEVVYIDEVEMVAYDGATGEEKFHSNEHASNTMFDYPVIADVDADDHAEIVVCHNGFNVALSIYGDQENSWPPARKLWNQHAYGISNINGDLTVPLHATPSFVDSNTWHAAASVLLDPLAADISSEIVDVCTDECGDGRIFVTAQILNVSKEDLEAGLSYALYAVHSGETTLLAIATTDNAISSGWSSDAMVFEVDAPDLEGADSLWLSADDDGTGTGVWTECSETNNTFQWNGPFCE